MTTCLGKSFSIGLLCLSFVNVYQLVCIFLSLWILRVGFDCINSLSLSFSLFCVSAALGLHVKFGSY